MGRLEELLKEAIEATKEPRQRQKVEKLWKYLRANWDGLVDWRQRPGPQPEGAKRLGAMEGQVRHIAAVRMKRWGASWTKSGANNMLLEFTYELAWKLMKAYLEYEGTTNVNSPRSAFKEAFAAGLIINGDVWIDMINDLNLTVHTYNEQLAQEIYERVKEKYYPAFVAFTDRMKEVLK